jgi:hypothetical protein
VPLSEGEGPQPWRTAAVKRKMRHPGRRDKPVLGIAIPFVENKINGNTHLVSQASLLTDTT